MFLSGLSVSFCDMALKSSTLRSLFIILRYLVSLKMGVIVYQNCDV